MLGDPGVVLGDAGTSPNTLEACWGTLNACTKMLSRLVDALRGLEHCWSPLEELNDPGSSLRESKAYESHAFARVSVYEFQSIAPYYKCSD